jgi:hypothetical protein
MPEVLPPIPEDAAAAAPTTTEGIDLEEFALKLAELYKKFEFMRTAERNGSIATSLKDLFEETEAAKASLENNPLSEKGTIAFNSSLQNYREVVKQITEYDAKTAEEMADIKSKIEASLKFSEKCKLDDGKRMLISTFLENMKDPLMSTA